MSVLFLSTAFLLLLEQDPGGRSAVGLRKGWLWLTPVILAIGSLRQEYLLWAKVCPWIWFTAVRVMSG